MAFGNFCQDLKSALGSDPARHYPLQIQSPFPSLPFSSLPHQCDEGDLDVVRFVQLSVCLPHLGPRADVARRDVHHGHAVDLLEVVFDVELGHGAAHLELDDVGREADVAVLRVHQLHPEVGQEHAQLGVAATIQRIAIKGILTSFTSRNPALAVQVKHLLSGRHIADFY